MDARILSVLLTSILVIALVGLSVTAHTEENPFVVQLIAGRHIDTGDVEVWNDGSGLYVRFKIAGNWRLKKTYVHVVTDPDDFPLTRWGCPRPRKFDYVKKHKKLAEYTLGPITDGWSDGTQLFIAAQAILVEIDPDDGEDGEEDEDDGKRWRLWKFIRGWVKKCKRHRTAWAGSLDGYGYSFCRWCCGTYFPYRYQ